MESVCSSETPVPIHKLRVKQLGIKETEYYPLRKPRNLCETAINENRQIAWNFHMPCFSLCLLLSYLLLLQVPFSSSVFFLHFLFSMLPIPMLPISFSLFSLRSSLFFSQSFQSFLLIFILTPLVTFLSLPEFDTPHHVRPRSDNTDTHTFTTIPP